MLVVAAFGLHEDKISPNSGCSEDAGRARPQSPRGAGRAGPVRGSRARPGRGGAGRGADEVARSTDRDISWQPDRRTSGISSN